MRTTRAQPVAVYTYAYSDAHARLRFLSASNHTVSGSVSDKDTWNVAPLLPVRFQSLRHTNTKSEPILWQAPRCMFCHAMLSWVRMQRYLLCGIGVTNADSDPSSERLDLLRTR